MTIKIQFYLLFNSINPNAWMLIKMQFEER